MAVEWRPKKGYVASVPFIYGTTIVLSILLNVLALSDSSSGTQQTGLTPVQGYVYLPLAIFVLLHLVWVLGLNMGPVYPSDRE